MADKIVQLTDKDNNNIFPVTQKNITMTDVDPGEGAALAADNYIAVYGGSSSLLDFFYPIGTYYETSDTAFNPNTTWGGTWAKDTAGRVLVAQDNGTFDTVGATGGNEKNTHQHWQTNGADSGSSYDLRVDDSVPVTGIKTRVISAARISTAGSLQTTGTRQHTTYNETIDILQPYKVVVRWHRVA